MLYICTLINNKDMAEVNSKQIYIFKNTLFPIVKIGMSDNPSKRKTLVENASGFPLELYFESAPILRPVITENLIHKRLNEFRQRGEWFTIHPEQAKIIIEQVIIDAEVGEYKDLLKEFHLTSECTLLIDNKIRNQKESIFGLGIVDKYSEEEEFIYRDNKYNYYIIYFQGELIRTVCFCNLHLAKKFKKAHLERLLKM